MQQLRLFFAMALLYMFRVTIPPIIRSTYAVYTAIAKNKRNCCILLDLFHHYVVFIFLSENQYGLIMLVNNQ